MLQLLQQYTTTFHPPPQGCPLRPIPPSHPRSPATSACRPLQAPRPTPATSRSCRLKSSACSTAAPGRQQAPPARLPPSPSRRPTAPSARPLPRTHPARPCRAPLHPRVTAPRRAACRSHQVFRDPSAPLQVSTLTTRAYRKPWTPSSRADRLSTTWWALAPLSSHPPGRRPAWARSRLCPCIPDITDGL